MKKCSICGEELPRTPEYFYRDKTRKDGLGNNCKECEKKRRKKYYNNNKEKILKKRKKYRENNKEKIRKSKKKYYENNKEKINKRKMENYKEKREYYLKKFKEYYRNNREEKLAKDKEYRENNKEKRRKYERKYYRENPEKIRAKRNRRRSRKNNLLAGLTGEQWKEIKKDFNNKCAYCGKETFLEQEHFIPLTEGGEYTKNNIIPACRSCNASKNNYNFFKWYSKQKFYSKKREKKILDYLDYKDRNQQLKFTL